MTPQMNQKVGRRRAKCALAGVFLAVFFQATASPPVSHGMVVQPQNANNADILGRWRLTTVLGSADIAAMSDGQARALIGNTVTIAKDRFVFNGEICTRPSYKRSVDDLARSFREEGHVSAYNMGLPDPVTSIDARCTHIFLKSPGRIVIHWDGFYFDAVR